jgi:hypothetical protein
VLEQSLISLNSALISKRVNVIYSIEYFYSTQNTIPHYLSAMNNHEGTQMILFET